MCFKTGWLTEVHRQEFNGALRANIAAVQAV
jgi:hypothetical protein